MFCCFLYSNHNSDSNYKNSVSGMILTRFVNMINSIHIKLAALTKTSLFIKLFLVIGKTEVGIYVTVFFIPLLPTKYILALVSLTIASFVINLLFTGKYTLSISFIDFIIILFAALLLYSIPISYIPRTSAPMVLVYLLFILFYFVCRNTINDQKQLLILIWLIVCSGAVVAFLAVSQKLFGVNLTPESWIDTTMFEGNQFRATSTLDNPNVLGEYLLFLIPIAFSMLYYLKSNFQKIISLGFVSILTLAMLLTLSRGAWLGLICGLAVFVLIRDRRLIWLGVIALCMMPFIIPQDILNRFMSIGNTNDSSTAYRLSIWLASTLMLKDFWPIGIGLSSSVFIFVFQKYAFSASYALHSHNLFLQLVLDMGIWGLILFLLIIYKFFTGALRTVKNDTSLPGSFSAALCAGMTGFLVQGMTDNTWYNYRIVLFFWVLIALMVACTGLSAVRVTGRSDDD